MTIHKFITPIVAILITLLVSFIMVGQNRSQAQTYKIEPRLSPDNIQPTDFINASLACPPVPCTHGHDVGSDFFAQVVDNLSNVPLSDFAVDALMAWKPYENTMACWNPLATTWKMSIVCNFNSVGVQNYQNQDMGVVATANTLNLSYYNAIRDMLRRESFDRDRLRSALDTWGTCSGTGCNSLLDDWEELWGGQTEEQFVPPLVGDVNSDGIDDIVFVGQGWDGPGLNIRSKVSNGDGTWNEYCQVIGGGAGMHGGETLPGDINGDGNMDVIFAFDNYWNDTGLTIRAKESDGASYWNSHEQVFGEGAGVHSGSTFSTDVNGDHFLDVVFAFQNYWQDTGLNIRTKFSRGDGTWESVSQELGDGDGVHTGSVLTGDVNGDGRSDLIFAFQHWDGSGLHIRTKMSNVDGTWASYDQGLGDGNGVHNGSVLIGDVNSDGRADLIFAFQHWDGSGLHIRTKISNSDGTWTGYEQSFGDGDGIHGGATFAGDVNGDYRTDVIFVFNNYWNDTGLNIRVKMSNGDGTWTSYSQDIGDGPGVLSYPPVIGDVNGDGMIDIILPFQHWNGSGLNIRTKISNGDGTWSSYSQVLGDGPGIHTPSIDVYMPKNCSSPLPTATPKPTVTPVPTESPWMSKVFLPLVKR